MYPDDVDLKNLLQKIFEARGFDFREYSKDMLKRQLDRRLSATSAQTYQDYAKILDSHPEEYKKLFDDLTVNVSCFFRDPLAFEVLYKVILPKIIALKEQSMDKIIRVWSAGCAQGEEAYSTAILLSEILGKKLKDYHIVIYATDIDSDALNKAQIGEYAEDHILEVKKGFLDKYFYHNGGYRINENIKKLVDFGFHDLTSEKTIVPPQSVFANFDLILCRNVLIYFSKELQKKVLANFKTALNEKGYLVLGETETLIGDMQMEFVCVDSLSKIYQKTAQNIKGHGNGGILP
jgi:chemotaxis methyl-accepting protein methylase